MATTVNCSCDGPIELDEYVQWVDENVDVQDQSSLLESASKLLMLSKNRYLLTRIVDTSLKSMNDLGAQAGNQYSDSTFLLVGNYRQKRKDFFLRMNVWREPRMRGGTVEYEKRLYSYGLPHDHNFDFLTVGYYGPGYRTRIYEYDASKVMGYIPERIDLHFLEETTLPVGKLMFYRNGVDVHEQAPPESLSISLNLIVQTPQNISRQQYYFDIEGQAISQYGDGAIGRHLALIELAGDIGNADTAEVLEYIGKNYPDPRERAAALKAFYKLAPGESERVKAIIFADKSEVVRNVVFE